MGLLVLSALAILGFIAGVGITAIGPGGVLATIALFALTDLTPAQVAGTAIVTHIGTGVLATLVYIRSGHLADSHTRRIALALTLPAILGTAIGVFVNGVLSASAFGKVLAVFVAGVAVLVWINDHRKTNQSKKPGITAVALIGFSVSVASGIVGVGGPLLSVPLLVIYRVHILSALAAAQVQSVVIATGGSIGYVAIGAIDWPLAALVGVPELAGVVLGWHVAQKLPTRILKYMLIGTLLAVTPYLMLQG